MSPVEIALFVALVGGAGLILAVAGGHWLGRPQGVTGFGLALLGVLLIGFPLFETFEFGVDAGGGATLKAELKSDVAATEAELVARLDALRDRLDALDPPRTEVRVPAAAPQAGGSVPPWRDPETALSAQPLPETGLAPATGREPGDTPPTGEEAAGAPPPAPTPAPDAVRPRDATALVFHRTGRRDDAAALVEILRAEGFAASAIPTDLVEAAETPKGATRILWRDGRRDAAEAVDRVAGTILTPAPRLDADPSELYRGDVQVQMF